MEANDTAVIERVLSGEPDAFRMLVDRHGRAIFRLGYRMTGNEHDAEDVVQETFIRAYRQLGNFESRANFGTWLHRIAVNCSLDLLKSRSRRDRRQHQESEEMIERHPSEAPPQDRLVHSEEIQQALRHALDRLSENERSAFVMRHFEGMSIEEIGTTLGTKVNATKNTIFRAVRKLREELEPLVGSMS